jgi:uncharacterized membrane-anchored protein
LGTAVVSEDQQAQIISTSSEGGVSPPATTSDGGATSKPRSGFARLKIKCARLTELYENLLADHDQLLAEHHRLEDSHDRLEQDYRVLEDGFGEVTKLNADLAAELRQTKQQRLPVRFGQLLGHR